jgi:DNA-binding LacI/PurR family transcriptional regulator
MMGDEKQRLATQKDVAKLAKVSQASVSRWVSGRGYVAEDARLRILEAASALNYEPHPLAQVLSTDQSDIVAIVMANITNPWYPIALERITSRLESMGLQALLFNVAPPQSLDGLIPLVLRYRVRGVIITSAELSSKAAEQCLKRKVPVVLFNRYTRTRGVTSVTCDNVDAGRMAAEVLLGAGARKLAFLGGVAKSSTSKDRQKGFTRRLKEEGADLVVATSSEFTYEWGYEGTLRVFEKFPEIDGIFCADDEIASGAMDALRFRLGKAVPNDVKVIGFDDHPIASKASYQITTFRQPVDEMIRRALDALVRADEVSPVAVALKGQLISRSSVVAS